MHVPSRTPARPWRLALLLVLTVWSTIPVLRAQAQYTIEPLPLPSNKMVGAAAVNDSGHVVGYVFDLGTWASRAFLYRDGVLTELPTLGGDAGSASGINIHGDIAGVSEDGAGNTRAFLYRNGVITDLGTLGTGLEARASGINDDGMVVGESRTVNPVPPGGGTWTAFVWDEGSMVPLGSLLGGTSQGISINNSGVVAGATLSPNGQSAKAFRYEGGAMTSLGQIGPDSTADSRGGYVNASGVIAGNAEDPETGEWHVFLHQNGILTDLGFPGYPTGINDSGHVVGQHADFYPFLYKDGNLIDINTLIDPGLGWQLNSVSDINNRGQIVGDGAVEGVNRAFILSPPGLSVIRPQPGFRWNVGERDTIRWTGASDAGFIVRFSADGGYTYEIIGGVGKDTLEFAWTPPDSLLSSADCIIRVADALDESIADSSGPFLVRGVDLARRIAGDELEFFRPSLHGWSFANARDAMWPKEWYEQFAYGSIDDPFTGKPFSERFLRITGSRGQPPADSSFPDWKLFVDTYGYAKCYGGLSYAQPTERAIEAWNFMKGDWSGSCFGFPTSALLAFEQGPDFFTWNGGIPTTATLFGLPLDDSSRRVVNKYFQYQSDMAQVELAINDSGSVTPRELLDELRARLRSDTTAHSTLSMFAPGVSRAHTLVPWGLVREGDGASFRVLVYDPNDPGKDDAYILIDSADNTWQEFLDLGYDAGSVGLFLNLPITHFLDPPLNSILEFGRDPSLRASASQDGESRETATPGGAGTRPAAAAASPVWIYVRDTASALIISESGDTTGYHAGRLWNQVPGALPMIPQVAVHHPPTAYALPPGNYTVTIPSATDTGESVLFQGDRAIYRFTSGGGADSPVFGLDSGLAVANPAPEGQNAFIKAIVVEGGSEFALEMDHFAVPAAAEFRLDARAGGGVELRNAGPGVTFDLLSVLVSGDTTFEFAAPGLIAPPGSSLSMFVNPAAKDILRILLDEGMDGSVDDSAIVAGTLLGVADGGGRVPSAFALSPNYPNPFNPSTTVRYDVASRGRVTLKVFDVLGREVATLVDRAEEPGSKSIVWDAAGRPAGVYFLRMSAGGFAATGKMLLVR